MSPLFFTLELEFWIWTIFKLFEDPNWIELDQNLESFSPFLWGWPNQERSEGLAAKPARSLQSRGFGQILGFETPKFSGAPSARFLSFCAVEGQFLSETLRKRTSNLQEKHCFQGGNHPIRFFRACGGLKWLLLKIFGLNQNGGSRASEGPESIERTSIQPFSATTAPFVFIFEQHLHLAWYFGFFRKFSTHLQNLVGFWSKIVVICCKFRRGTLARSRSKSALTIALKLSGSKLHDHTNKSIEPFFAGKI